MTIEDIALTLTPGIGTKGAVHLLEHFGDAEHIFAASDEELCSRTRLRPDLARRITQRVALPDAEREWTYCLKNNIHIVASTDPQYPPLLRETPDYPHVLYIRGNVDALTGRCLSMVGTRDATPYGQRMCNELIRGLAERVPRLCIVSGLAFGIDVTAHRAALAAGVQTVAVLPNPLPDVTPAQHRGVARDIVEAGGALVSELHSQVKQRGTFYLARNRIIAGLSAGTVVVESPCGGGVADDGTLRRRIQPNPHGRAGTGCGPHVARHKPTHPKQKGTTHTDVRTDHRRADVGRHTTRRGALSTAPCPRTDARRSHAARLPRHVGTAVGRRTRHTVRIRCRRVVSRAVGTGDGWCHTSAARKPLRAARQANKPSMMHRTTQLPG